MYKHARTHTLQIKTKSLSGRKAEREHYLKEAQAHMMYVEVRCVCMYVCMWVCMYVYNTSAHDVCRGALCMYVCMHVGVYVCI